ncbi:50S ribosomal protein L18 [Candidatus Parcubacteria bacterium]|nr:MAG: 50S ribosomal protein L18 [Candidatus Parcubacteria bacterium]
MNRTRALNNQRSRRARRARAGIVGSAARPRLAIFRSNRFVYAQLIDDEAGRTILQASSRDLKQGSRTSKAEQAKTVGETLAKRAKEAGILKAVCDRRAYRYHGRVKALVEAARSAGLSI